MNMPSSDEFKGEWTHQVGAAKSAGYRGSLFDGVSIHQAFHNSENHHE